MKKKMERNERKRENNEKNIEEQIVYEKLKKK